MQTHDELAKMAATLSEAQRRGAGYCPTCGASSHEPCRVLSHRDERERSDHKARLALRNHLTKETPRAE